MMQFFKTAFCAVLIPILCTGCFIAPPESTRQALVPEKEVDALRINNEGLRYLSGGRFVDAEFRFRQALWLQPNAERIFLNLAASLFMQERYDESLEIFKDLYARDPLNLTYRIWVGKIYTELGNYPLAEQYFKEGITDAESRPDLGSMAIFGRSLANLYVRIGSMEDALCYSIYAYSALGSLDEGLKHIRLLLLYGKASSADYWFKNILPASGDGSLNYHLRRVETSLLMNNLDEAKTHIAAALHLNASDAIQTFDRRLLTVIVGKLLEKRGETVELSVLDNDSEVEDLLQDDRTKQGPLALIAASL
jgi:tetratricopeptide (TPR) repeat protein